MALLIGRHVNKIDRKGRVSVPKPFRDSLSDQSFSGIYVYPSFKSAAIEACNEAYMEKLTESLEDLDMFSEDRDDLASIILSNAHALNFDPEGRVVIPQELRDHAKIDGQALFIGLGKRFQIWSPEAHADFNQQSFKRAQDRGTTLALRKKGEDS